MPMAGEAAATARRDEVLAALAARGEAPRWRPDDLFASCAHGTVRMAHGIELRLRPGRRGLEPGQGHVLGTLTAHGGELFRALPAGGLARWLLPLRVKYSIKRESVSLVLGAKKLSRATLLRALDGVVAAGDKPFVLELRRDKPYGSGDELLCFLPTTASLVLRSLREGEEGREREKSCVFTGDISNVKPPAYFLQRTAAAYAWLRWFALALALCAVCWQLLRGPAPLLRRAPALWPSQLQRNTTQLRDVVLALPSKPSAAFQLGVLHERLSRLAGPEAEAGGANASDSSDILAHASRIVGQPVDGGQLRDLLRLLVEAEQRRGAWQRMVGAITFINTLWLGSIIGMSISLGPSCYHLVRPLHEVLARTLKNLYQKVLLPLARRLHRWCVLELAVWAFCILLTIDGARVGVLTHGHDLHSGALIALTGTLLSVSALGYSTLLHGRKAESSLLAHVVFGWLAACWVPLAIHFQSRLLAEFAVLAVFCALGTLQTLLPSLPPPQAWMLPCPLCPRARALSLPLSLLLSLSLSLSLCPCATCSGSRPRAGFGVWISPLCLMIGFASEIAVERVFTTALVLHTLLTTALCTGHWPPSLEPFSAPVAKISNVMLFLSLLIISSEHSSFSRRDRHSRRPVNWYFANIGFVALVAASMFLGPVLALEGMTNAANTFAILYALDKYAEFHLSRDWNGWVLVLLVSVAVWQGSLFLTQHPQHLASILHVSPIAK